MVDSVEKSVSDKTSKNSELLIESNSLEQPTNFQTITTIILGHKIFSFDILAFS